MKIFNPEFKEQYISQSDNENSQNTIRYIFTKSYLTESILNKDLYDFSREEVGNVIRGSNPYDKYSAYNLGNILSGYIDFSIEKGMTIAENPLSGVQIDWYEQFVNKKHDRFTKDDIYDIVERLENVQDQAMIALAFEGASGKDQSELRNIQIKDVNELLNLVTLRDDGEEQPRIIRVSDWCMDKIQKAFQSTTYQNIGSNRGKSLVEFNDYLFRNIQNRRASGHDDISYAIIYNRICKIQDEYNLPFFKFVNIRKSGILAMAAEIAKEKGKIDKEDFEKIATQFNFGIFYQEAYQRKVPNISYIKRYVNSTDLKKYYDINVEI